MKLVLCAAVLGLMTLGVVSCSFSKSNNHPRVQEQNYLAARSIPPLRIPPGVSSSSIHTEYPVSDRQYPESALKVNIEPPGLNS